MRILVDAMGGDLAPKAAALGAIRAAQELGTEVVLVGRGEAILQCLKENGVEALALQKRFELGAAFVRRVGVSFQHMPALCDRADLQFVSTRAGELAEQGRQVVAVGVAVADEKNAARRVQMRCFHDRILSFISVMPRTPWAKPFFTSSAGRYSSYFSNRGSSFG